MPTVSKIHLGPGDLFVTSDLTAAPSGGVDLLDPTSSAVGTMLADFSAPAKTATPEWRAVGFTNGPATITYRPTYYMVETEQAFAEVLVVPTSEEASLTATLQELDYRNMHLALGQSTTEVNATDNTVLFVGGKVQVNLVTLALASRKRTGVGYFMASMYQVYSSEGAPLNFERRAETRLPVNLRALADATRPVGDQLFQVVDHAANPVEAS